MDAVTSTNQQCYHEKKEALAVGLQHAQQAGLQKIRLEKATSNLFRPKTQGRRDKVLDVKDFNTVIDVDKQNLVAEVEGMTTYERLVDETLKYSCLPTVVPELKTITIGGALSGCGIESSSFRYGLVHETIQDMDILLGDGQIVSCSSTNEHRDLFYAFPNTFGTLGYALKVSVKLIPAKKFVKLTHLHFSDQKTFFSSLKTLCLEGTQDYIEGVIFHANEMVITLGEFVDEVPWVSNYRYRNIYYRSLQTRDTDYLTTLDYIWRWDPDWFWCSDVFFMQNPLMRFLFGKWMLGSAQYGKVMRFFNRHTQLRSAFDYVYGKQESIIQDISIPVDEAERFYEFFREKIGIQPIWICPTKAYSTKDRYDFCPMDSEKLYLDFGFWKSIPSDREEGYYNRMIEKVTTQLGGFKSLYSSSYYTEEEFWSLYDQKRYDQIKKEYDPEFRLRGLYEKCTTK
jgi:FAD/FMN-containing dehydrogenase